MTPQLKKNLISLIGLGVFVFLAIGSYPFTNKNETTNKSNTNQVASTKPADTTKYSNSSEHFNGPLKENYVDFSFD